MVDLSGDNVALFVTIEAGKALQAQVIRLSGARSEHNLFTRCTNQVGDMLASIFTSLFSLPTEGMGT